ncbi:DNA cytosine methyltransferase [Microvirgula curvata]
MAAYYNEIDPYAASWLRNLIAAGHIAPGEVDERDIRDVHPSDIREFTQCHFFAGIGVWSYALRRAGWSDDRPVWSGSCPCQPFSSAGAGLGFADKRHLWPHWHHLISECRPAIVIGEQVASKDADPWLDALQDDMEGVDYAVGAVPFPSAGVGAPHIRDRLYWVAHAASQRFKRKRGSRETGASEHREAGRLADPVRARPFPVAHAGIHRGEESSGAWHGEPERPGTNGGMAHSNINGFGSSPSTGLSDAERNAEPCGSTVWMEHASSIGRERGETTAPGHIDDWAASERTQGNHGSCIASAHRLHQHDTGPVNGFWRDADWLLCRDGKWRPVEPGTFPLAHGAPARVGRLRAYGNAINAEAARLWIETVMERMP